MGSSAASGLSGAFIEFLQMFCGFDQAFKMLLLVLEMRGIRPISFGYHGILGRRLFLVPALVRVSEMEMTSKEEKLCALKCLVERQFDGVAIVFICVE